jgi:hypothetical protein
LIDVPEITGTGGCLGFEVSPMIGTDGSFISRENGWFFDLELSEKLHRRFFDPSGKLKQVVL